MEKNRPSSRIKPRIAGSLGGCCGAWIKPRTTSSLGGCCGAWSFQPPGLLLHCCWPMLSSSTFMSPSLPSLAFCPKHKLLEARHVNTESPLWRKTVPRQGLGPGPPALWADALELHHSSTQAYCSIAVGLILSPPTFTVLPCLYECITLCAGEGLRTPCPYLYPAWPSAPSTNHWKPDMEMLKVPYGEKPSLVKD